MTYDLPDKHNPQTRLQQHMYSLGTGMPHHSAQLQPPSSVLETDLRLGWPGVDLADTAQEVGYGPLTTSAPASVSPQAVINSSSPNTNISHASHVAVGLAPPAVTDTHMRSSNPNATSLGAAASACTVSLLDPSKPCHPEWGVIKEQDFHALTLKHQRDLENLYQAGTIIPDFYFWQANLGGYCMADMIENVVVSSEGVFTLVRRVVEGVPHPGRRKKKRTSG